MSPATNEQIRDVCALLHSRGREATPEDVWKWLFKFQADYKRFRGIDMPTDAICRSVLSGVPATTMCLHIHFGDAL